MQYRPWNFVHTIVLMVVLVIFLILACTVGAKELQLPKHGTMPIDHSMSMQIGDALTSDSDNALLVMVQDDNQLQHESSMALIETAMRIGEVCTLLAVQLHAKKHSKPISLNELSKQADVCVAKNLKMLERK